MDKIYYISQGATPEDHLKNITNVCEAGCRLVQLRIKNQSIEVYKETASKAKIICDSYGTQLIINDLIEISKAINSTGIHLGKNDKSPAEAKQLLGAEKIIGGTANTLEDCLHLINQKVDYIGLGPFNFTTTKDKLSPILGIEGYQSILSKIREKGHKIPIYAIGGILEKDAEELFKAGVFGIAISGLISDKPIEKIKNIINQCNSVFHPMENTNKQALSNV